MALVSFGDLLVDKRTIPAPQMAQSSIIIDDHHEETRGRNDSGTG